VPAVAEPTGDIDVSVLVPTFNAEPFVRECLWSIRTQSHELLEIIVVDDCSVDGTYEIVQEIAAGDERFRIQRNDRNLGNMGNFAQCLELASAPLVKFVCSDDTLAPQAVERMTTVMTSCPGVSLVTSSRIRVDEHGQPLADQYPRLPDAVLDGIEAGNLVLTLLRNWIGEPTTVMFRRDCLALEGLYDLGRRRPERNLDVVWWLKIILDRQLATIAEPLSTFRIHDAQISQQPDLLPDLVLSWYEIISGAEELGYLAGPETMLRALAGFVNLVQIHLPRMPAAAHPRVTGVLSEVEQRIRTLVAA